MIFSILQAFKLSSLQALNPSSLKSSGKESSRIPRATAPSPPSSLGRTFWGVAPVLGSPWAPKPPSQPPSSQPRCIQEGFQALACTKMSPHSSKIHEKSLSWSQHPPKQFPRCPSHPSQAPKECRKPIKTLCFQWFLLSRQYAKLTPKSCKKPPRAAQVGHPRGKCDPSYRQLGSKLTHLAANLAPT